MINQLAKLQHTFQNCVLKPGQSTSIAWVSASGRATPETQLSIYNYAYHARLNEVLANDYPAILMAIGDEHFNQLAANYIEAHPSHYFSLRDFGSQLANFIATLIQQQQKWQEMPWLYELALFEWNLGQVFDAADDTLFTEHDMSTIAAEAWPELRIHLHSSVQRLDFEWNIIEIWQALTDETPTEVTAKKEASSPWLIWREKLTTRFRSMQADEQIALDKLAQGGDFTDICEELARIIDEDKVPMHAASLLKGWISQGLISDVE